MKVLLDTCAFLWIAGGARQMSARALEIYQTPDNEVFLSAASAWEISLKHGLGELSLPEPPERFVPNARARHGLTTLPIDEESALHASKLPLLHRDPFDRILISQSIVHGMAILTPDPLITQYPARTIW